MICKPCKLSMCFLLLGVLPASGAVAPSVDVSLAPPEPPSALSAAIAGFDSARESFEHGAAASEVRAFNAALRAAKPRIDAVAKRVAYALVSASSARHGSSASFLGKPNGELRGRRPSDEIIDVDVVAGRPIDVAAAVSVARGLEAKWATHESQEFSAKLADFNALTDFVVRGAEAAAQTMSSHSAGAATSFVDVPSVAGPVVAAIAAMEARREVAERLGRSKHLSLAVALLHRENEMLRAALHREVDVVNTHGASFLGAGSAPERYTINLQPPQEDEWDIASHIDGVMLAERAKQRAANTLFSKEKQRALDAGKAEIEEFVRRALA